MSNKIYSLEQFIFNVATIFLNPKEMYYFKIFVLANRSTNREKQLQVNNVFNHAHMRNYIQMSSLPEDELKLLDDEAKHKEDNQQNKDVDPDIMSLQQRFHSQLRKNTNPLNQNSKHLLYSELPTLQCTFLMSSTSSQKGSKYTCNYSTCTRNRFSLAHESEIQIQTKSKDLINCPVCKKHGVITKIEGKNQIKFKCKLLRFLQNFNNKANILKTHVSKITWKENLES
ncbi:Hypothetical_protein [Hexamita inflata]|uniref:Hypothetical_protein n=1 Tax=Hexamita inflata TaxID=28002 RepID=A0AA86R729_9EUKA|nr:Hypothetical protein HINF_LOCUS55133 [Hexamita inflata]